MAIASPATDTHAQARPKVSLDQFAVAAPGEDAEPHGELLHHEEDGDEQNLQQQQAIAPLHAALAGGDDAADVGVGQHDHDPGPEHRDEARRACAVEPLSGGVGGGHAQVSLGGF